MIGRSATPSSSACHFHHRSETRNPSEQPRRRAPIIAVQLEYSLLERTAEGELFPMAQEMGIGMMPWSPLKQGFLSGKFPRENTGSVDTKRTAMGVPSETDYLVIDALCAVAEEVGASARRRRWHG
jgi:aryl-alcohol dehydrogenase-like predicted oxidoreductase